MDVETLGAAIAISTQKTSADATRAEAAAELAQQTLEGRYIVTTKDNKIIISANEEE